MISSQKILSRQSENICLHKLFCYVCTVEFQTLLCRMICVNPRKKTEKAIGDCSYCGCTEIRIDSDMIRVTLRHIIRYS